MTWLLRADTALFTFFNARLTSSVLDVVMPFISDKSHFILLGLLLIVLIIYKDKKAGLRTLIVASMAVILSDFLAAQIKDLVSRIRPCHALTQVNLLVGCGGSYSFPSGHAANIFTAMVFLSLRYKKYSPLFLAIAVAVAYSRVYVGVHYPLDVLGGAMLGTLTAFGFDWIDRKGLKIIKKAIKH